MDQAVTGFHLDEHQDWVAELACGHNQHVRHQPPWTNRPRVVSPDERAKMLGTAWPAGSVIKAASRIGRCRLAARLDGRGFKLLA